MTEIRYYPLIDCDTEGTEKVAMIPTLNRTAIMAQSKLWLEEVIPGYFRLRSRANYAAEDFNIHCPRCGQSLKRISNRVDQTKLGLYVCSACDKK